MACKTIYERESESKGMITNKNINWRKNIQALEELFDSQHKNKNM